MFLKVDQDQPHEKVQTSCHWYWYQVKTKEKIKFVKVSLMEGSHFLSVATWLNIVMGCFLVHLEKYWLFKKNTTRRRHYYFELQSEMQLQLTERFALLLLQSNFLLNRLYFPQLSWLYHVGLALNSLFRLYVVCW